MTLHFNLADLFEVVVDTVPDREALVCGDKRATYSQLDQRSNKLAQVLQSKGVGAGDHVGLYMYNCSEYIEAMLACFKIRAVPININFRYVSDELLYLFTNADMVACIHHREFVPTIARIEKSVPQLHTYLSVDDASGEDNGLINAVDLEQVMNEQSGERHFDERSDDDKFILYTGGTTGMPKGVVWPHKNLFYAAMGGGCHFSNHGPCEKPEDIRTRVSAYPVTGIGLAPLMHGASWWYSCVQLLAGNKLVLNHNHSLIGEQVWDICEREKINVVQIVGDAMAIPLLDALEENSDRWDLSAVASVGSGGAIFSDAKQSAFRAYFPDLKIVNGFGSSESGHMGTDRGAPNKAVTNTEKDKNRDSSGLGNVERSQYMDVIIEDSGERYRHAEIGEMGIFSRSGHIPVGYYNDPEKTAKTFVSVEEQVWLLTGDSAKIESDGSITIYGRGSNCINTGGEKVFPEEVENALKSYPVISDVLVIGTPDERWGSKVTAVVQTSVGHSLTLQEIQEHCRQHITGYKIPRELHIIDQAPRLLTGKPDYKTAERFALSGKGLVV